MVAKQKIEIDQPRFYLEPTLKNIQPYLVILEKSLPPDEVSEVVQKLGNLADIPLVRFFDQFRPFTIHNSELRHLRIRLLDPQVRSQPEQKKTYNLIFDGSGVRNVFESHFERLKDERDERISEGQIIPAHLHRQIEFCESVMNTLGYHEGGKLRLPTPSSL